MPIIAVASLKGGTGKTSIALHLAANLKGSAVADADPQGSATRWAEHGDLPFPVVAIDAERGPARFQEDLEGIYKLDPETGEITFGDGEAGRVPPAGKAIIGASYRYGGGNEGNIQTVILDTPPELAETAMLASLLADLILIPSTPSALDLWAAQEAVALAREARGERDGKLPLVSLVPSKLISRTREAAELPDTLRAFGEPVAPPIYNRVAVARATIEGRVVSPSTPAGQEFQKLARHVQSRLRRI